jgi:uncharacterized membrane protein required for colicin V production
MPLSLPVIASAQPVVDSSVAGSPIWQLVFLSFAVVLILFEVLRGWRRGVARQLARLGGLICAYGAAWFGGRLVGPMLRPFLKMPDFALSVLAGAVLAFVVYAAFEGLGTVLFRRTNQHDSLLVRLLFGAGGAVLGLVFGIFFVWLVVVGIRSVGAVAESSLRTQSTMAMSMTQTVHPVDERRKLFGQSNEEPSALAPSLARLKNSIETGVLGAAVKRADVVPAQVYDNLGKIGAVVANPDAAERFLSFPGARELSQHPKIIALRDDSEISDMATRRRYLDLLQNDKIIDAANDPDLRARLKSFDVTAALDYAIKK